MKKGEIEKSEIGIERDKLKREKKYIYSRRKTFLSIVSLFT